MDIWERLRYARDRALKAEETERQRLADADSADLQQAASVRLATRQAVREALDDVLDEHSEPERANSGGGEGERGKGGQAQLDDSQHAAGDVDDPAAVPGSDATGSLAGTSTTADQAELSYAGAGSPDEADVQESPGSQTDG